MATLYVGYPDKAPNYTTINRALDSLTRMPETEKIFPAPMKSSCEPVNIYIAPGTYEEQFVVNRPFVTLIGESAENTVITYYLGAREILEDGLKRGTFRTASVRIDSHDFTAKNLTFINSAGYGSDAGQALALYVDADRVVFENCRFLGSQDTLFTAPLPEKEFEPGGFRGPGEHKPRTMGRHYYKNCFIRGDVDFIFGGATAYFEGCTIFSQYPGDNYFINRPDNELVCGYITAASTPKDSKYGYVFRDCRLIGDAPKASVYLGRPWREYAKTVYINCELGEHINPFGWNDWGKPHGNFYFGEYASYGPGASPETRAGFSHQLTAAEAAGYTVENVLGAPDGWQPCEGQ